MWNKRHTTDSDGICPSSSKNRLKTDTWDPSPVD
jgi:hypothetical protein